MNSANFPLKEENFLKMDMNERAVCEIMTRVAPDCEQLRDLSVAQFEKILVLLLAEAKRSL